MATSEVRVVQRLCHLIGVDVSVIPYESVRQVRKSRGRRGLFRAGAILELETWRQAEPPHQAAARPLEGVRHVDLRHGKAKQVDPERDASA